MLESPMWTFLQNLFNDKIMFNVKISKRKKCDIGLSGMGVHFHPITKQHREETVLHIKTLITTWEILTNAVTYTELDYINGQCNPKNEVCLKSIYGKNEASSFYNCICPKALRYCKDSRIAPWGKRKISDRLGGGGLCARWGYARDGAMRESNFYFGYFWSMSNMQVYFHFKQ